MSAFEDAGENVEHWSQIVRSLYESNVVDPWAGREATQAIANLWSGSGLLADPPLTDVIIQALELGYAVALRQARDGKVGGLGPVNGSV